jgi:hypothetical protein
VHPELTIDQAAATVFAIGHPETYRTHVLDGDWDDDRWASWGRIERYWGCPTARVTISRPLNAPGRGIACERPGHDPGLRATPRLS